MAAEFVNLVKLCVGAESVESLASWQSRLLASGAVKEVEHVTRMRPRRAAELLNGGSLYWVIRGLILARQRILRLDQRQGADGIMRCAVILDRQIVRTAAVPRGPFQGWRYLEPGASPPDLPGITSRDDALPDRIANEVAAIGVI